MSITTDNIWFWVLNSVFLVSLAAVPALLAGVWVMILLLTLG